MRSRLLLAVSACMLLSASALSQDEKKQTPPPPKDVSQEALYAKITLPWNNSMVRATVPVFGFAGGKKFKAYRVEYGEGKEPKAWIPVSSGTKPWNEDPWSAGKVKWNPHSGASGTLGKWSTGLTSYAYQHWKDNLLGEYTLRLVVEGNDGTTAEDRVHVIVAEVLTRAMGGNTRSPDGRFSISAAPGSTTSTFVLVSMLPSTEPKLDPRLRLIGTPYEFQPPGIDFLKPATLTVTYADADLDTNADGKPDIPAEKLGIYYYLPVEETWARLPSRVSPASRTVVAEMASSTKYLAFLALMADVTPPDAPKFGAFDREIPGYSAAFAGTAEPGTSVDILLDGQRAATCRADDNGKFTTARMRIAPGPHELSAKAVDAAGNESVPAEKVALSVAPTPPKTVKSIRWLGNVEARAGDRFLIELIGEDASDRVDHALASVTSETDPKGIEVELTETGPKTGIYVALVTVADQSSQEGSLIRAFCSKEKIAVASALDPAKRAEIPFLDDTPPTTPRIECAAYPVFYANDFEDDCESRTLADWRTVEGKFGAGLSLDESKGNRYLKLTRQQWQSHMGAVALERPFETRDWPLVSFDCMIPQGMKIDLMVSVKDLGTFTVRLTGEEKAFYPQISQAFGIRTDGQWTHILMNLHSMLSRRFPGRASFHVEKLQFGNWADRGFLRQEHGASGAAGVWVGIDNFAVLAHKNVPAVTCTWKAEDANGVAGYSAVFDRSPNTVPPADAKPIPAGAFALTEPGVHYLHVRAADSSGNWSRTAHYMFLSDREPPTVGKMSVESKDGRQIVRVPVADTGVGLDLGAVSVSLGGRAYDWASGTLSYAADTGMLTFDPWAEKTPVMPARGEKMVVSLAAADLAGQTVEKAPLGEYAAESPLVVNPPNPNGPNGFYLKSPEISYDPVAGEKAFFDWQVKFPEDELSRKGQSLNELQLTIKYPDGKSRSFVKAFKLDTTTPKTAILVGAPGAEKPFVGGVIPAGAQIVLTHDDYALKVGGVECRLYSDGEFKSLLAVKSTDDFGIDVATLGSDAKVLSAVWVGALRAAAPGDTLLRLTRLDPFGECRVLIDGEVVATKPRDKVREELECRAFLTKGWHRIEVRQAFKAAMQRGPDVFWSQPGKPQSEMIPSDCLATYVRLATTRYQWDGGVWQEYSSPIIPPRGAHRLSFYSEDLAGHKEMPIRVDVTVP